MPVQRHALCDGERGAESDSVVWRRLPAGGTGAQFAAALCAPAML
jgi:hypothetical protein